MATIEADVRRLLVELEHEDLRAEVAALGLDVPMFDDSESVLATIEQCMELYEHGGDEDEGALRARVKALDKECAILRDRLNKKDDVRRIRILDQMLAETPGFAAKSLAEITQFLEEVVSQDDEALSGVSGVEEGMAMRIDDNP